MGEHSAMCEKILCKLENILSSNSEIQEFAVVPTPENEKNKSPVLYEQNCLGLESWCKKYLLQYTHTVLLKNRKALLYKQLPVQNMKNLNHILVGALLIQPNITTFWNMKRELVKCGILNSEHELYFSRIVLSQHSKCSEIFSYRKWLLNPIVSEDNYLNHLGNELNVCEMAAEKSNNNYHAWNHRIWCFDELSEKYSDLDSVIFSELNFSINWISKHISENTGYYYRQHLIKKLNSLKCISSNIAQNCNFNNIFKYLKLPTVNDDSIYVLHSLLGKSNLCPLLEDYPKYVNVLAVLLNDLVYISTELNFLYRDHECLWNYRKFIVIYIMKILYEYHGIEFNYQLFIRNNLSGFSSHNMLHSDINSISGVRNEISKKIISSDLYNVLIKNEAEFVESNKNSMNTVQNNLALRHLKWLKCTNFYDD